MSVTISGTNGITFNNSSTQAQSAGLGSSATAQTWQDLTASRASGTTYTNSTGYPIMVASAPNVSGFTVVCGGITLCSTGNNAGFSFIVPNGTTYSITGTINSWAELR